MAQVPISSYASSWFLTLFGSALPLPCVERLFDLFILDPETHGLLHVFKTALAIIGMNHELLLRSNFESILTVLGRVGLDQMYQGREDELVAAVCNRYCGVSWKRLAKLEKDYDAEKQARANEESELAKTQRERDALKDENARLKAKVQQLEHESEQLAEKLVERTVELSDRAIELSVAQEQLELLRHENVETRM